MRYSTRLIAILACIVFSSVKLSAQCNPDTVNCKDDGEPGQICPRFLPEVNVNVAYDEVITVIPPGFFSYLGSVITIEYIVVDSVNNLPNGITYHANADIFYPDTAYCVQIVGTPTEAGDYPLRIYVTAYIDLGTGPVPIAQIADTTSVVMTVNGPAGIDPFRINEFHVIPNVPNPFSEVTMLGFYTPFDDHIRLQVYNILGKLVHEEKVGAPPGEQYFNFNGGALMPGTYFYRITNNSGLHTGKFIKSK